MLGKSTHLQVIPQQSTQMPQTWGYGHTTKTSETFCHATRASALASAILMPTYFILQKFCGHSVLKSNIKELFIAGVIIETVEPSFVDTPMVGAVAEGAGDHSPPRFLTEARKHAMISVEQFVNSAVNTIGWADKCEGHLIHYVSRLLCSMMSKASQDKRVKEDLEDVGMW